MTLKRCVIVLTSCAVVSAQAPPTQTAQPTATISGVIRDAGTGKPAPDASLYATNGAARAVEATSDAQGKYTLRGLTSGTVRITARGPLVDGIPPATTRIISVASGQELSNIDFMLRFNGEISGKVIDQNREPVPGVSVFLVAREYSLGALRYVFTSGGRTDDQGEYTVKNVSTGRAFLVFASVKTLQLPAISEAPANPKLRRPAFVPTYYPGTPSPEGAMALTLQAGERRQNIDIQVQRSQSYCVEGTIGSGEPVRFQIEEAQPSSGSIGDSATYVGSPTGVTGADGKVRICDLHPGQYRFSAFPSPSPGFIANFTPTTFGTGLITIGDRDETQILVTPQTRLDVPGEVLWDGAAPDPPVSNVFQIALQPLTRTAFATERTPVRSTIPGKFSFTGLFTDDYSIFRLNPSAIPTGAYVKDMTYGDRSVLMEPFRPGSTVGEGTFRVILARDGGTISANVADKDGHPMSDFNVVILPESAGSEAALAATVVTGQTDQNGAWTSGQLAPGKYFVIATQSVVDRSAETIAKFWRGRDKAKRVDLGPKAAVQVALDPLVSN
jgi:hypothetical protein